MTQRTSRGRNPAVASASSSWVAPSSPVVLDAVDVEELARPPCCRAPVSISTEPVRVLDQQAAHGERNPVALVGRDRACSQSGFGTTPNIAPPSRRWSPPSSVWQRSPPTVNACERRHDSTSGAESARGSVGMACRRRRRRGVRRASMAARSCSVRAPSSRASAQQAREQLGGHQRVAGGAVAGAVLEAESAGEVVEPAGADALHQPPRQPHGAEPRPVERQVARPAHLGVDEVPSRSARCGRRRCAPPGPPSTWSATSSKVGAARTISSVMLVMARIDRRDRPARDSPATRTPPRGARRGPPPPRSR